MNVASLRSQHVIQIRSKVPSVPSYQIYLAKNIPTVLYCRVKVLVLCTIPCMHFTPVECMNEVLVFLMLLLAVSSFLHVVIFVGQLS
jgi:hypothetical protein